MRFSYILHPASRTLKALFHEYIEALEADALYTAGHKYFEVVVAVAYNTAVRQSLLQHY